MASFEIGQSVVVQHRKPWHPGKRIQMRGAVAAWDGKVLLVKRRFVSPGQPYDGLYARQLPGDRGTIELHRRSWISRRRYLRHDGALIGELFNIQTPTQFRPGAALYVDLEIDVAYLPARSEKVMIQDADDLRQAVSRGYIPHPVALVARQLARDLAEGLREWDGSSLLNWDLPPNESLITPAVEDSLRAWSRET